MLVKELVRRIGSVARRSRRRRSSAAATAAVMAARLPQRAILFPRCRCCRWRRPQLRAEPNNVTRRRGDNRANLFGFIKCRDDDGGFARRRRHGYKLAVTGGGRRLCAGIGCFVTAAHSTVLTVSATRITRSATRPSTPFARIAAGPMGRRL